MTETYTSAPFTEAAFIIRCEKCGSDYVLRQKETDFHPANCFACGTVFDGGTYVVKALLGLQDKIDHMKGASVRIAVALSEKGGQ